MTVCQEEGKELLGVTGGEPDPMEEVNRRLAEAGRALSWSLSEAVEAIGCGGELYLLRLWRSLVESVESWLRLSVSMGSGLLP